jgi:N-acylglucosamine 2-epimerase
MYTPPQGCPVVRDACGANIVKAEVQVMKRKLAEPAEVSSGRRQAGGRADRYNFSSVQDKLAGVTLQELYTRYRDQLFQEFLPFWEQYGIDHERGGFMCALDYDGTRVNTHKFLWFQGRGIWIYSFLYNHFEGDERYLDVARKTKDFVLKYASQQNGWWAELLSRKGQVLQPFSGDVYGMYFVAEGLQEYAWATKDDQAREIALSLIKKLYRHVDDPSSRFVESGAPVRPQGLWMVNLRLATQVLERWADHEIEAIADRCIDAVINKHFNPDIGLNNEVLNFDFTRPKGEETKSLFGHSIETLWMVMDEALRRGDQALWDTCAERIRRHLEVGWDHIYGGLAYFVNVDHGDYVWPPERPVGTGLEFLFVGEYHYMKTLWSLNEILIAALNIFERTRAEWAARFFDMTQEVIDQKFSMKKYGYPGYMLFADRRMTYRPHTARQDNYHPPRQLMLNLLTLDRMIHRTNVVPA